MTGFHSTYLITLALAEANCAIACGLPDVAGRLEELWSKGARVGATLDGWSWLF